VLHLLHEDLKANKLRELQRLPKLLIELAITVDPYKKAAFVEYYVKEMAGALKSEVIETLIKKAYKDGNPIKEGIEIENVPKLIKWLTSTLKAEAQVSLLHYPYPIFFENTRKIVRIYEILNSS
jgi:hypothetical protein